ncbi:S1 family peptidase [Oligoflexus tunisiensis]|uniref:S1 family peptidase n=1 Tax=Oligoflexus tunisiensis TaxID=708132 RepID=UPI00159EF99E|nr:serine protease [Oligoflexus tunisiensis]
MSTYGQWVCVLSFLIPGLSLAAVEGLQSKAAVKPEGALAPGPYCTNEYADDLSALNPKARELEQRLPSYTFCIRTLATYECPSYGPDGNLRRKKRKVVGHGTAFAYRTQGGETYIMTNEHVADWPVVTDEQNPADDVPAGCKRVSDSVKIVDDESDSFDRDDIQLTRVVSDPQLDITILKTKEDLPVLPWKIGHSSGLKERNVVDVRGFPLGVFKATNAGKVIAAYDHDEYKEWDHVDFVIDALLSPGNSGSPVFAVSCKTGEFELVGVYHAGYTEGSALNVVIGIDQIRELMTTFKRKPQPRMASKLALNQKSRLRVVNGAKNSMAPYFPFGNMTAAVRYRTDGTLVYELLNRSFPTRVYPVLVMEDLPSSDESNFGIMGRIWIGNRQGLKHHKWADLDADAQEQFDKLLDAMRAESLATFDLRDADRVAETSREKYDLSKRLERALQKASAGYAELASNTVDFAEKRGPQPGEIAIELRSILASGDRQEGFSTIARSATPTESVEKVK